jgi:hypothetical protein
VLSAKPPCTLQPMPRGGNNRRALVRCAMWLVLAACSHSKADPPNVVPSPNIVPPPSALPSPSAAPSPMHSTTCNGAETLSHPRLFPDAGPCDDSEPIVFSQDAGDLTCHYVVRCASQPLRAPGCQGLPNDLWGADALRRCPPRQSYPAGCTVNLPTANPHYAGRGQLCECQARSAGTFAWTCGL